MIVELKGRHLPGITCNPGPGATPNENVHVGIGNRGQAEELFRGDADLAIWRIDVKPVPLTDGSFDYRARLVQGPRGDRFIYLNWGSVESLGTFRLFRRAKVMLSDINPRLVDEAVKGGCELHADIDLTDPKGNPTCARLRPPDITWSVVHPAVPEGARQVSSVSALRQQRGD